MRGGPLTSATSSFEPERLGRARQAVADSGLGAVFLTPGPDLRYVTGYDAKQLERLTCLVVPATGDPFLVVPRHFPTPWRRSVLTRVRRLAS